MSFHTEYYGRYVIGALESNALVFSYLLRDVAEDSAQWDARPDAERFSLREVVAHLLDYDTVCRERFERMIREQEPELPNWDEGEAAEHYASRNPLHDLETLQESRRMLAAWLEGLTEEEWQAVGSRPGVGQFSVEQGVSLLLGHDSYHLRQVVEWLQATQATQ
jgi:uncharacterized damage-inducible protein DinB